MTNCARCKRDARPDEDPVLNWEATDDDGRLGFVCPGCATGREQEEKDKQIRAMIEQAVKEEGNK